MGSSINSDLNIKGKEERRKNIPLVLQIKTWHWSVRLVFFKQTRLYTALGDRAGEKVLWFNLDFLSIIIFVGWTLQLCMHSHGLCSGGLEASKQLQNTAEEQGNTTCTEINSPTAVWSWKKTPLPGNQTTLLKTAHKGNHKSRSAGQGKSTASLHLTGIPNPPDFAACGPRWASQKSASGYMHFLSLPFFDFGRTTNISQLHGNVPSQLAPSWLLPEVPIPLLQQTLSEKHEVICYNHTLVAQGRRGRTVSTLGSLGLDCLSSW